MKQRYTRRSLLVGTGAVVVASGCLGNGGGDDGVGGSEDGGTNGTQDEEETDGSDDGTDNGNTDGGTDGEGASDNRMDDENTTDEDGDEDRTGDEDSDDDLDLREANVMGVSVDGDSGTYRFDVTLHHDDDGEEGYANWWQVESLGGERLGRRDLTHPHGTREFTRSDTVETGEETCVVVRGHDQTHGYGGRVVVVNVETGKTRGFLQGEERSSFDESDCP